MNHITFFILTIMFSLGAFGIGQYHLAQRLEDSRARVEQESAQGREWMEQTTAQLNQIHEGIERITGDTIELAQRIDGLSTRITTLETTQ